MKSHHLTLGLVIAGLALFLTFRNVSFHAIYESVRGLEYQYLPVTVVLFFSSFVVRVYRWHYLCRAVKPIPSRRLFSPMMIGFMGNLLPLRAGEFIRAYLLGKREDLGFSASFATIVVERIFDMASVLVLFAGLLVFNPQVFVPDGGTSDPRIIVAARSFGFLSLAVCLGLIAFCYFLLHQQERTVRLVRFFTQVLPHKLQHRIDEILRSFTQGLGVLRDPKGIFAVVLLSAIVWAVVIVGNYPLYYAYKIESIVPPSSLVTLVVLLCAAVMIPTPGFIGPFQLAATFVLADLYGVERSVAASFSLVIWFLQMSTLCLAGIFFLLRDNISLVELSRTAREMGEHTRDPNGPTGK
jgi:uncharacterized protein (TIRG00374 family)